MQGAFSGVNKGQLETENAFGMPRFKMFRRIWLPQAIRSVLPPLEGGNDTSTQGNTVGCNNHCGRNIFGILTCAIGHFYRL